MNIGRYIVEKLYVGTSPVAILYRGTKAGVDRVWEKIKNCIAGGWWQHGNGWQHGTGWGQNKKY